MLTLRKTWVKDSNPVFHVPSSQPMTDLGLIVYFLLSDGLAKVSEETLLTTYFHCRVARRAAPGGMPSY